MRAARLLFGWIALPEVFCALAYKYEPLHGDNTIRVLDLRPNTEYLECKIRMISYKDGGYQALSYVWGSDSKPFEITVLDENGIQGTIPLTTSLFNALNDLRESGLESMTYWIDQISINQADNAEKGPQVALMSKIYSHASQVITYIGPAEDKQLERKGAALLQELYDYFAPNYEMFYDSGSLNAILFKENLWPIKSFHRDISGTQMENWLVKIAFGEWTQRLWMVQEQVLNTNTIMLRGRRRLDWLPVATVHLLFSLMIFPITAVNQYWEEKYPSNLSSDTWFSPLEIGISVYTIWRRRWEIESTAPAAPQLCAIKTDPLVTVMSRFKANRCRDPRDRYFGLLAIASDTERLGIRPDYSTSTTQVFYEGSIKIFSNLDSLELGLGLASRWNNELDPLLPSWAITAPRTYEQEGIYRLLAGKTPPYPWTSPRFDLDRRALILRGFQVSSITFTTNPTYYTIQYIMEQGNTNNLRLELSATGKWCKVLLHVGVSIQTVVAFWLGLSQVPGYKPALTIARSPELELVYQFWCYLRVVNFRLRTRPDIWEEDSLTRSHFYDTIETIKQITRLLKLQPGFPVPALDKVFGSTLEDLEEIKTFGIVKSRAMWRGRSFGVTSCRKVFSALNPTEIGDVIVAFEGSRDRLWTLRPVEGKGFRLVGDVYVPGYMKGQHYVGDNHGVFYPDEGDKMDENEFWKNSDLRDFYII